MTIGLLYFKHADESWYVKDDDMRLKLQDIQISLKKNPIK